VTLSRQVNNVDHGWKSNLKEHFMSRENAGQRDEILEIRSWDEEDVGPPATLVSILSLIIVAG
jgi:hypothetical protein